MFLNVIGEWTNSRAALSLTISLSRNEVKPLTDKVSGALYKGFNSRQEAECAYIVSYGLGIVQVISGSFSESLSSESESSTPTSIVRTRPTENELLNALQCASSTFLGVEWYAVFKGVHPGVYPTWYVRSNSYPSDT